MVFVIENIIKIIGGPIKKYPSCLVLFRFCHYLRQGSARRVGQQVIHQRGGVYSTLVSLLFLLSPLYSSANISYQPKASSQAVVVHKNARFTVLTPRLVRMEWHPEAEFEDRASLVVVNRKLSVPRFNTSENDEWLRIKTDYLLLEYKKDSGPFDSKNISVTFHHDGKQVSWHPGVKDLHNLGGTARTLDGMNGGFDGDGKAVDLGRGIISRSGWYLLDDSSSHLFDGSDWDWVMSRSTEKKSNAQDFYFFGYASNYKQALADYTSIAGKIPVPPRYAFGYWWSRYWVYSDVELKSLMEDMRDYDIPIDVLVIDMDWHLTHGGLKSITEPERDPFGELLGWTGYTWNNALFPEPESFLDWTSDFKLKTALNLHPASGVPPMEEQYQPFADAYGFDTSNKDYIPYQMAEKKWAETYFEKILRPLEDQGVDFWWLDWQQFPDSKLVDGLNNTWWLNYTFFTDMERQNKRPLLFHRWGGLGNHRYQIGFSGDDKISWESLNYQTYFTSTAANVGYGYWSHDIGGHAASEFGKDPELYTRWIQFGILSPIFRTHSAKISSIERRFWMYPEHFPHMRELVHLRYALNPYLYTAARQAYDTGLSMVRPMYYDHPNADQAYEYKHQYMLGDDLLVAPIATPVSDKNLLAEKNMWLPDGHWYEWHSGTMVTGGIETTRKYALNEIPMFAKAGSVIPMYPKIDHLQEDIAHWVLTVVPSVVGDDMTAVQTNDKKYPNVEFSQTFVYDDDGDSSRYHKTGYTKTRITNRVQKNGEQIVTVFPPVGKHRFSYRKRAYDINFLSSYPPTSVTVNGKSYSYSREPQEGSWHYEGKTQTVKVSISPQSIRKKLVVEVDKPHSFVQGQDSNLQGTSGFFRRLDRAMGDLKIEAARESWWATMPNSLLSLEQIPSKMSANPKNVETLLRGMNEALPKAMTDIRRHNDIREDVAQRYIGFLLGNSAKDEEKNTVGVDHDK